MPSKTVVFHRLTAREYRSAHDWYALHAYEVSRRFCDAVDQAVGRIASEADFLPKLGPVFRWVRVRRFPYVLIFCERSPSSFMVMAVAHTSRRPGYWRGRR